MQLIKTKNKSRKKKLQHMKTGEWISSMWQCSVHTARCRICALIAVSSIHVTTYGPNDNAVEKRKKLHK